MTLRQVHLPGGGSTDQGIRVLQKPAVKLQQVRLTLDAVPYGANAVAETAVSGRTDWTNDANALGKPDGAVASITGNVLAVRGGRLDLSYADFLANKGNMTITQVLLRFYIEVTGTTLNNGEVGLQWSKDGTINTLETITGNVNNLITPREFDITASITGWADIDALRSHVRVLCAIVETYTANLDAVELVITAEQTVTT